MITLENILNSQSPALKGAKVKLVRHKDSREEYRDILKDKEDLLEYQKIQPKDVFGECDYIVSFVGLERNKSDKNKDPFDLPADRMKRIVRGIIWRDKHFTGATLKELSIRDGHGQNYINRCIQEGFKFLGQ